MRPHDVRTLAVVILLFVGALVGHLSAQRDQTLNISAYNLDPGPSQTQSTGNVEVTLRVIHPYDVYRYPDLFSFDYDAITARNTESDEARRRVQTDTVRSMYEKDANGLMWELMFGTPDGRIMLMTHAKFTNNTPNIIRMKDARVYLIPEGKEPVPAISSLDALLNVADDYEQQQNAYLANQRRSVLGGFLNVGSRRELPRGFYRSIVLAHRDAYKLINDFSKEILPGFSYEGFLFFPAIPEAQRAQISFFDITTKVDPAGNPIEKTRMDFPLVRENGSMWYDRNEKRWKSGSPSPGR